FIRNDEIEMDSNQIYYTKIIQHKKLTMEGNCLDYSSQAVVSQADCWENCILEKFVTKYQKIPKQMSFVPFLNFQWINLTFTHQRDEMIEYECNQNCFKLECATTKFTALDFRTDKIAN